MTPRAWTCVTDASQPANIRCLEDLFGNLIAVFVSLTGLALFVMLVVGGFTYLTAGADPERSAKARQTMMWAIGGIVAMILSYIILRLIATFTGVDILDFSVTVN